MTILEGINHLTEYINNMEVNEEFSEFSSSLNYFTEKNKEYNLNNFNQFETLVKDSFIDSNESNKLTNLDQIKNAVFAIRLAEECTKNGYLNVTNFHQDYLKYENNELIKELRANQALAENAKKYEKYIENSEKIQDEQEYQNVNEQNIDDSKIDEIKEESQNISFVVLNENTENENVNTKDDTKAEDNKSIDVEEMIAYIKNKEQIHYPFDKESTLDNKEFMNKLFDNLRVKSNEEIIDMINAVRAKNDALRKEIKELQEKQEFLTKGLEKELADNQELSNIRKEANDSKTIEALNQDPNKIKIINNETINNQLETVKQMKDTNAALFNKKVNKLDNDVHNDFNFVSRSEMETAYDENQNKKGNKKFYR